MLDPRCPMLEAGKGSSIEYRASRIEHRGCVSVVNDYICAIWKNLG
ncbi:MAG: hypothetical protein AB1797_08160 [bacterium]